MSPALAKLVRAATKLPMNEAEREEQQIRFSYGSSKIENDRVTEEMVRDAAARLKEEATKSNG